MASSSTVRIEPLNKENYDTWKIQVEALLVKNDAWAYVNGTNVKPEIIAGNAESVQRARAWEGEDRKARSDLILSISPSELKQIKGCDTSREVWRKLQEIYQSKGPARKATLLKRLTLQRMEENDDVREHLRTFFDTVDKLGEMDVDINRDLLSVMLLYSLPISFENFRCAIESRDELPPPEILRIKITEESDARKNDTRVAISGAMLAKRQFTKRRFNKGSNGQKSGSESKDDGTRTGVFKYKCHRCRKVGHKAIDCNEKRVDSANKASGVSLRATVVNNIVKEHADSHGKWCLDSGCTAHLCKNVAEFVEIAERDIGKLNLANNASTEIKARGTVLINTQVQGRIKNVSVHDTLHVPDLRTNLLSVARITDKGFRVIFNKKSAVVMDEKDNIILQAERNNDLYYLREGKCDFSGNTEAKTLNTPTTSWHRRMGHLNFRSLVEGHKSGAVRGMNFEEPTDAINCEICIQGKMTKAPFSKSSSRKSELLEIIHSDVCGPMKTLSNGGKRYFVTFIDDCSRWCEVHFLKGKDEVFNAFNEFKSKAEALTGKKIRFLQSDNGREYRNRQFDEFLKKSGISRRLAITYTPEQNGVAERRNRTLVESARCLLLQSKLPRSFWAEAVNTANYIRNRCPSSSLEGKTAFEIWTGCTPDVSYFKDFGCEVYTLDRMPNKEKFQPRSKKGIFVGYSDESKAYRIWLPHEKKVDIARDVRFLDDIYTFGEKAPERFPTDESRNEVEVEFPVGSAVNDLDGTISDRNTNNNDICEELDGGNDNENSNTSTRNASDEEFEEFRETPHVNGPKRGRGRPRKILTGHRGRPRKLFHYSEAPQTEYEEFASLAEIPTHEAIRGPEADEWYNAMASELKSIIRNDTWEIVERPENRAVIDSRVVLRNKYDSDGNLERRKARIVARGFSQKPGIDFKETFAPVARLSTIRTMMALAAEYEMNTSQCDVTTAYLNGELEERIFMEVPPLTEKILERIVDTEPRSSEIKKNAASMWTSLRQGNKVCLLKKALYGLRQAGRRWHERCSQELKKFGLRRSSADPCLYYSGRGEELLLVAVYVDDILIASRDRTLIDKLKGYLSNVFDMKDLGTIKYCLGIEFSSSENGITMCQSGYVREILTRFGMSESKPVASPLELGTKLRRSESPREDASSLPYRELIGTLMYLAVSTRPDIAYTVSYLSQFCSCFDDSHWIAAKRVLRYLKGTANMGIIFKRTSKSLEGYVDADWANCPEDRRSYTGYAFILAGCPITWESRKQRTVALSSTEAEYMALSEAAKEGLYMRRLLLELGCTGLADVRIYVDNNGARKLAENPVYHCRTKHIDVRHHFVREVIDGGHLKVLYTATEDMAADLLTKGLAGPKLNKCINLLGIRTIN